MKALPEGIARYITEHQPTQHVRRVSSKEICLAENTVGDDKLSNRQTIATESFAWTWEQFKLTITLIVEGSSLQITDCDHYDLWVHPQDVMIMISGKVFVLQGEGLYPIQVPLKKPLKVEGLERVLRSEDARVA